MKTRILSAVVLIAVVAACFLLSPVSRALFILAAMLLAVWELCRAIKQKDIHCAPVILYIYTVLAAAAVYFKADAHLTEILFLLAVVALLSAGVIDKNVKAPGALAGLAVLVYPLVPFLMILRLSLADDWVPVFVLGCISTWICDSFALFGGSLFGKHKLCPSVSPNKTVEGAVSGAVAATLSGVAVYFALRGSFDVSLLKCTVTAFVCSSFGQMGDLAASLIKRETGIKDYSNLIPGHGGVMDRVDSLLFSIPVASVLLSLSIF